jgi:type II secretory pathway component PulM
MIQEWFANLELRERVTLLGGVAIGLLIVVWGGIWNPLSTGTTELGEAVASKRALLSSLQRARSIAAQPGVQIDAGSGQSLVLLVDQTHRNFGLEGTLTRNQPDGADGIRVTFQNSSFDSLIAWLAALHVNYGIVVDTATIDGARTPGIVNATVVLRR